MKRDETECSVKFVVNKLPPALAGETDSKKDFGFSQMIRLKPLNS
jgi:hypothetical protein